MDASARAAIVLHEFGHAAPVLALGAPGFSIGRAEADVWACLAPLPASAQATDALASAIGGPVAELFRALGYDAGATVEVLHHMGTAAFAPPLTRFCSEDTAHPLLQGDRLPRHLLVPLARSVLPAIERTAGATGEEGLAAIGALLVALEVGDELHLALDDAGALRVLPGPLA